MMWNKRTSPNQ